MSSKDAPSERPIAGRDTATMFESSMIREDTSEDVSRNQNPEGAAAWFWSVIAVMLGAPAPASDCGGASETELQTSAPEPRERYGVHSRQLSYPWKQAPKRKAHGQRERRRHSDHAQWELKRCLTMPCLQMIR